MLGEQDELINEFWRKRQAQSTVEPMCISMLYYAGVVERPVPSVARTYKCKVSDRRRWVPISFMYIGPDDWMWVVL